MDPGAAFRQLRDAQATADLIKSHSHAADPNPSPNRLRRLPVPPRAAVVDDDQVQLQALASQLDRHLRGEGVSIDIGQGLLDDAENDAL